MASCADLVLLCENIISLALGGAMVCCSMSKQMLIFNGFTILQIAVRILTGGSCAFANDTYIHLQPALREPLKYRLFCHHQHCATVIERRGMHGNVIIRVVRDFAGDVYICDDVG